MYEYVIPQEFNQADKIGNYTLPQLAVFGAGALSVMILFAIGLPYWLAFLLALPIAAVTLYFMFKKVNGIPMYEFILVYLIYKTMPKIMIYKVDNRKEEFMEEEELLLFLKDE